MVAIIKIQTIFALYVIHQSCFIVMFYFLKQYFKGFINIIKYIKTAEARLMNMSNMRCLYNNLIPPYPSFHITTNFNGNGFLKNCGQIFFLNEVLQTILLNLVFDKPLILIQQFSKFLHLKNIFCYFRSCFIYKPYCHSKNT